jgi:hypothetical protein
MNKIVFLLIALMLTPSLVLASDVAGRTNSTSVDSLVDWFYDKVAAYTSQPWMIWDTTLVIQSYDRNSLSVSKDFYAVERDTTITVTANTEWYALPSDFLAIPYYLPQFGCVSWGDDDGIQAANGMQPTSIRQVGSHRDAEGIPLYYLVQKFQLHIEPANTTNDTVRVYYAATSNKLDALADVTNIDLEYIDYLVLLTAEDLLRAVNAGNADAFMNKILAETQKERTEEEAKLIAREKSIIELMAK